MPRLKRTSPTLTVAQSRIAALETINPKLDLGNGISVKAFNAKIEETRQALEEYNKALSAIDQSRSRVTELERSLASLSTRMLSGVATLYGRTSSEYEMTNGSKRRRTRSVVTPESPAPVSE
jgi:uncharacterized protein YukE